MLTGCVSAEVTSIRFTGKFVRFIRLSTQDITFSRTSQYIAEYTGMITSMGSARHGIFLCLAAV
jgi:hypothetical protein